MEYRVLGEVAVVRDGLPIDLAAKQRALLALLLIDANRIVSTDRLIDELWDDTGQDRQNALWVVISRLRGLLEPDRAKRTDGSILVTRPPGYMLVVDPESVDSVRFESLTREGRSLIDVDPHAASLVLSEALALWRGHAFEEFTYTAFAEAEIARLSELRIATVENRIAADLTLADRVMGDEVDAVVREVIDRAREVDPSARFPDARDFLAAYDVANGRLPASSDAEGAANPYRGLQAFHESDASVFFGRERLIERLLTRIGATGPSGRFVAVVGPSGSGKSSVVRAGVVPALRRGAVPGSERWFITTTVPGRHPFASLADALRSIAIGPPDDLVEQLRTNGVAPVVRRLLADDTSQVVIVVDQLEELFVQSDSAEADEFLSAIAAAVTDRRSAVRVVTTLRADFYGAPLRHPDFGELVRLGTDAITPLSPSELERAITGPANQAGVTVEPGVVAAIATDMVGQATALPLMQSSAVAAGGCAGSWPPLPWRSSRLSSPAASPTGRAGARTRRPGVRPRRPTSPRNNAGSPKHRRSPRRRRR